MSFIAHIEHITKIFDFFIVIFPVADKRSDRNYKEFLKILKNLVPKMEHMFVYVSSIDMFEQQFPLF